MKNPNRFLFVVPFLSVVALALSACAAETDTPEEPDQTVKVKVEEGDNIKPKMRYWCEPGTSDNVEDCRSGTCQPAEITCDDCSWWQILIYGGCWVSG
jgi:hypothetical protein